MDPATITTVMGALGWGVYVPVVLAVVGLSAHVAAVLPPAASTSPSWWRAVRRGLDLLGGNYGSASNATEAAKPSV